MKPQAYMAAWRTNNQSAFRELLAADFTATEADGATYYGLVEASRWFADWHARFVMQDWVLTHTYTQGMHTFAQWTLTYADVHTPEQAVIVDGATDYVTEAGRLVQLTEYQLGHQRFRPFASSLA